MEKLCRFIAAVLVLGLSLGPMICWLVYCAVAELVRK